MLRCTLQKQGAKAALPLGPVSHCLHGYLDYRGLRGLQLDVVLTMEGNDARGVVNIQCGPGFPAVGDHIDWLQLRHTDNHITHHLLTTATQAGGAGGWSLNLAAALSFAVEQTPQIWRKGLWLSFRFFSHADADNHDPPFRAALNEQEVNQAGNPNREAVLHPYHRISTLGPANCLHGSAVLLDGNKAWEFVRNRESLERLGKNRLTRYEKDRTQANSLLHAAFRIAEACRSRIPGNGTVTFSEPNNASHETNRDLKAGRTQREVRFTYGQAAGDSLVRLHFLEYGGHFRGKLEPPPLSAYADGNNAVYTQPEFWLDQLSNLLTAEHADAEDQGIPREVITLVTT